MRILVLFLIASFILMSCLIDDDLNLPLTSIEPTEINDGHVISSASAEAMDEQALQAAYNQVYNDESLWSVRSMLVFRNGRLVAEAYPKDEMDIMQRHIIWSCTKQVMGVLTGIAIENGLINSLDDPIDLYLEKELVSHQDKKDITIKNLISMQSGIAYENGGVDGQTDKLLRQIPSNSVDFVLKQPINAVQGTKFHYNDGNPHLMSAIIQNITGKPTDVWANEVLFSKIGLTNYNWVHYKDGVAFGGFGIETTPRELAKVALLVANNGSWQGDQIVPASWIESMVGLQVETEFDYNFGYFWWLDPIRNIHFMWGAGGQFAFIVPDKNLVIVMTSFPNTLGDFELMADEALPIVDLIIEAAN